MPVLSSEGNQWAKINNTSQTPATAAAEELYSTGPKPAPGDEGGTADPVMEEASRALITQNSSRRVTALARTDTQELLKHKVKVIRLRKNRIDRKDSVTVSLCVYLARDAA